MTDVPFECVVMAGCSDSHCIVEYEKPADREILEVELFGLFEDGEASSEWRSFEHGRADSLGVLKRMVTDP